jgi:hypothetical protein
LATTRFHAASFEQTLHTRRQSSRDHAGAGGDEAGEAEEVLALVVGEP